MQARKLLPGEPVRARSLFQSGFWAAFRSSLGQETHCLEVDGFHMVCLMRRGANALRYAYLPRFANGMIEEDERGAYLESVALAIRPLLPEDTVAVRFDTAFRTPYTSEEFYCDAGQWKGAPRAALRELRMNFGTSTRSLRKAPHDHFCPDTVVVDLRGSEEDVLARMRATTRNSIRRAYKSGVVYRERGLEWLPAWYDIYADTAGRKGFYREEYPYFEGLLSHAAASAGDARFFLLQAEKDGRDLAGIIVAAYGEKAYYLYAGSRDEMRECMPNYGLQWEAIRLCRKAGAMRYDLMGVPPNNNPRHPMAGLYTFKTGLGGELIHYAGCWDYPYDDEGYRELVTAENLG